MNLLIFDECHRVTKKDPSNLIMQEFYHPLKQAGVRPSAPPVRFHYLKLEHPSRSDNESLPGLFERCAAVCETGPHPNSGCLQ